MIKPQRSSPQSPFSLGLKYKVIFFPIGFFYRLWVSTIRFRFIDPKSKLEVIKNDKPVIITLWHNRLFLAGEWQRRFRGNRKCFGLISGSRDGAWLEAFYGWSGIHAIRGSSNRGGSKAIRDLVKTLKNGNDVGITPDGSRGPVYEAKPGVLLVGKLAKVPLLLLGFKYGWHIKLNSWDKFIIPFPFSIVRVKVHVVNPKDFLKDRSVEEGAKFVGKELMKVISD